jgi:hypothetical protein
MLAFYVYFFTIHLSKLEITWAIKTISMIEITQINYKPEWIWEKVSLIISKHHPGICQGGDAGRSKENSEH